MVKGLPVVPEPPVARINETLELGPLPLFNWKLVAEKEGKVPT